jgi:hypothetical protein
VRFSAVAVIRRVPIFSRGFINFSIFLFLVVYALIFVTEGPVEVFMGGIKKG